MRSHVAHVPQHIVHRWCGAVHAWYQAVDEGQRKRPNCSASEETTPPVQPNRLHTTLQWRWCLSGLGLCQRNQELTCLLGPSAPYFRGQHHQSCTTPISGQLRIGEFFPPSCKHGGCAATGVLGPSSGCGIASVVTMGSCAPLNKGRPSATTSNLQPPVIKECHRQKIQVPHNFFCRRMRSTKSVKQKWHPLKIDTRAPHDAKPAWRKSRSTSYAAGVLPSAPTARGSSKSERATARATAQAISEPHRKRQACPARRRNNQVSCLALALAS